MSVPQQWKKGKEDGLKMTKNKGQGILEEGDLLREDLSLF